MQAGDAHFCLLQLVRERREDIACQFQAGIELQDIAPTALLQPKVQGLGLAHGTRNADHMEEGYLLLDFPDPGVKLVLRSIIDHDHLNGLATDMA